MPDTPPVVVPDLGDVRVGEEPPPYGRRDLLGGSPTMPDTLTRMQHRP